MVPCTSQRYSGSKEKLTTSPNILSTRRKDWWSLKISISKLMKNSSKRRDNLRSFLQLLKSNNSMLTWRSLSTGLIKILSSTISWSHPTRISGNRSTSWERNKETKFVSMRTTAKSYIRLIKKHSVWTKPHNKLKESLKTPTIKSWLLRPSMRLRKFISRPKLSLCKRSSRKETSPIWIKLRLNPWPVNLKKLKYLQAVVILPTPLSS